MIEVIAVSKHFGRIYALKDVSFEVRQGEVVGLLGPNGSGKTTMMQILSCFTPPSTGSVRIEGLDVAEDSLKIRRMIGYFLERVSIYPDMRVKAFLRFAARIKGIPKGDLNSSVGEAVETCGLEGVTKRIIGKLSKGYRQRVGLAQALLNNPPILLLDEPTAGVDPEQVAEIRNLIHRLAGKRTIILSSHILSDISQMCEKVIIIHKGEVKAADTIENLCAQVHDGSHLRVQIKTKDGKVLDRLKKVPGIIAVAIEETTGPDSIAFAIRAEKTVDLPAVLWELAVRHEWTIREIYPIKMSLEDIFFRVVKKRSAG